MKNSNILELNLFPISDSDSDPGLHRRPPQTVAQQQQLTIFYNGNVCVADVTELQAKAILLLARREEEEKLMASTSRSGSCSSSESTPPRPPLEPNSLSSSICNPNGLSMKKSLQRFLQKRNNRIQSTFPYTITRPLKSCSLRRY